ncbi:phosphotransferase enzyme family protein [Burkholderia mallei GB8 horse 4]|nr:phosphotransferase enzyme family protein [Burkholderia mallei GB8 horse 4]
MTRASARMSAARPGHACRAAAGRLMSGVWRPASGVRRLASGVWRLAFGVWHPHLASCILLLASGASGRRRHRPPSPAPRQPPIFRFAFNCFGLSSAIREPKNRGNLQCNPVVHSRNRSVRFPDDPSCDIRAPRRADRPIASALRGVARGGGRPRVRRERAARAGDLA